MIHNNEFEKFERIGVEKFRSYYIPFAEEDKIAYISGIVDRTKSSRFLSLDGAWKIKQHGNIDELEAFDYEEFKKNGFKVNKLGDYDLTLDFDKKPE